MSALAILAFLLVPAGAGTLEVKLDPKLELVGVVELLAPGAQPPGFERRKRTYDLAAERIFSRYRGHPAVSAQARLDARRFDFVARCELVDRLSPLFEPTTGYPLSAQAESAAGGKPALEAWLAQLRDFARASRFDERFAELQAAAEPELKPLRDAIVAAGPVRLVESYTGLSFDGRYTVTASPFLENERMRNSVSLLDDGTYELRTFMGLDDKRRDRDYFFRERLPVTLWHQLEHGVLDLLADLNRGEIDRRRGVYDKLPWTCFGDWPQCVKENIVRAVFIRMAAPELGDGAALRLLKDEPEENYPYMKLLLERLREYESRRDLYPSLADFYGRLLEVFPASGPAAAASDPFRTDGQRKKALRLLDRMRERSALPPPLGRLRQDLFRKVGRSSP
ncbi:MAG: DUF4932 domain-containing protein [Elusimicrobia bacterium]|nr:DUF4932 domain-containing protein [Elusimicrobiota bacterium]